MPHDKDSTFGKYTSLALMEGELASITVKEADAGEDLLVFVPSGPMTERAVAALRLRYPTNQIVEKGARPGVVIHVVQTMQDFAALQAAHAKSAEN